MSQTTQTTPIYDTDRQRSKALYELIQVWHYRDLIYQLIYRDVTARYKRSVLGIAWTMLNPLGTMIILSVVFSQVFPSIEGYVAYVLSGLLVWNFFAQSTAAGMNCTWRTETSPGRPEPRGEPGAPAAPLNA